MSDQNQIPEDLPELPDDVLELPELPDDALHLETATKKPAPTPKAAPKPTPSVPRGTPKPARPAGQKATPPIEREVPKPETKKPVPAPQVAAKPQPPSKPAPAPKPEPKPEPKVEAKPVPKPEPVAKTEPKPAAAPPAPTPEPAPMAALEEVASEPASAPADPSAAPAAKSDGPPPLRELDKAPLHLRKAALIVAGGSLLPFMGPTISSGTIGGHDGWWISLGAKAVVLVAAYLWLQQILHNFGPKQKGVIGTLAELTLAPKKKEEEEKPKRRSRRAEAAPTKLSHPFPTGLHVLSLLLIGAGVFVASNDPRTSFFGPLGVAEYGMFGWAAFTWVHIASYERWGGFNPLFPMIFLGMLFAGIARVLAGFSSELTGLMKISSLLGGLTVAAGGGLAAFTIVEAMMQAKKEGDRKKREASEARKAARKAKRA